MFHSLLTPWCDAKCDVRTKYPQPLPDTDNDKHQQPPHSNVFRTRPTVFTGGRADAGQMRWRWFPGIAGALLRVWRAAARPPKHPEGPSTRNRISVRQIPQHVLSANVLRCPRPGETRPWGLPSPLTILLSQNAPKGLPGEAHVSSHQCTLSLGTSM